MGRTPVAGATKAEPRGLKGLGETAGEFPAQGSDRTAQKREELESKGPGPRKKGGHGGRVDCGETQSKMNYLEKFGTRKKEG